MKDDEPPQSQTARVRFIQQDENLQDYNVRIVRVVIDGCMVIPCFRTILVVR